MENESSNLKSIKLYSRVKGELERLVDTMLAPMNREPDDEIKFPFDMYIEDDELVIEVEMPGLEKECITIEGIDRFLEISGEKDTVKKKYKNCVGLERTNGKFKKIFFIEKSINMQDAEASIKEGVLIIRFPLVEEKRGKKIININ